MLCARTTPIDIPGVLTFEPFVPTDHHGSFAEPFHRQRDCEAGISEHFVQDMAILARFETPYEASFPAPPSQGKLVMALEGTVCGVILNIGQGSIIEW